MSTDVTAYPHTADDLKRFNSKVHRELSNDCWAWAGSTFDDRGYGVFTLCRRVVRAHRFAWYAAHLQPIPAGMVIRHSCDNPRCVNPRHLLLGTQQDNVDDRNDRGRTCRGEAHPNAKLSDADVVAIQADPRPQRAIARTYGVARTLVQRIKQGRHRAGDGFNDRIADLNAARDAGREAVA